ncbi:unannotated protein [freshwater metagenome]|uniref:Unannotated protein n=1 Tax=freshwater metagenome TaxID=449393 RepID=A0A6J7KJJ2_9ZZZZ
MKGIVGTKTPRAAAPQSGPAIIPAIMYAINPAEITKNTFSTVENELRNTKNETAKAATGTEIYLLKPNNCPAAAIPANSAVMVPIFANINAPALNVPDLAPYFWRIKPIIPCRVTTPILAPKSCRTISANIDATKTHNN